MKMNKFRFFNLKEFTCKCSCGRNNIDLDFVTRLDFARAEATGLAGRNLPFIINSGCRCPKHNEEVGSTSNNHILGLASDITCFSDQTRLIIIRSLLTVGFRRIGVHKTYIHVDQTSKPESLWSY